MQTTGLPTLPRDFAELEHPSDIRISGAEELTLRVSRDSHDYAPVRHRIKCGMSNRFHGWNCDFDSQFDAYAYFFLLSNNHGDLLAGSRLILPNSIGTPLPLQLSEQSWSTPAAGTGEYSGFWFERPKYGLLLAGIAGLWIDEFISPTTVFAVYESSSAAMHRLYLDQIAMDQIRPHSEISYPSFTYKRTGECVRWTVAVDHASSRRQRCEKLLSKLDPNIQFSWGAGE